MRARAGLVLSVLPVLIGLAVSAAGCSRGPDDDWPAPGDVKVRLPRLCVPGNPMWRTESVRALVWRPGVGTRAVLGYEPLDGRRGIRTLKDAYALPEPAEGVRKGRSALILCGNADDDAYGLLSRVYGFRKSFEWPRLYLAGVRKDGAFAALPLFVPSLRMLQNEVLGWSLVKEDLWDAVAADKVLELRITRSERGVRFRWGHVLRNRAADVRWDGGDRTLSAAEVESATSPVLPELMAFFHEKARGFGPARAIVMFELGTGVRYVHFLRAVECGLGTNRLAFFLSFSEIADLLAALPVPASEPDWACLRDDELDFDRNTAGLDANGRCFVNGRPSSIDDLRERLRSEDRSSGSGRVILNVERQCPWRPAQSVLRILHDMGATVDVGFCPEDPQIAVRRLMRLTWGDETDGVMEIRVGHPGETDLSGVKGRVVRIVVDRDLAAGGVLRAMLEMNRRGAKGFVF